MEAVEEAPHPYPAWQSNGHRKKKPFQEHRVVSALFVKTRLCRFHGMGICARGASCTFAHTKEERKPLPNLTNTKLCPNLDSCDNGDCCYAHSKEELRSIWMRLEDEQAVQDIKPETAKAKFAASAFSSSVSTALSWDDLESLAETNSNSDGTDSRSLDQSVSTSVPSEAVPGEGEALQRGVAGECDGTAEAGQKRIIVGFPRELGPLDINESIYTRTKMCKFFLAGCCLKQNACTFAHGPHEMRPAPVEDMSNEPLCPKLTTHGYCHTKGCTFSHNRNEFRRRPSRDAVNARGQLEQPNQPAVQHGPYFPQQQQPWNGGEAHLESQPTFPMPSRQQQQLPQMQQWQFQAYFQELLPQLNQQQPLVLSIAKPAVVLTPFAPQLVALQQVQQPQQTVASQALQPMFFTAAPQAYPQQPHQQQYQQQKPHHEQQVQPQLVPQQPPLFQQGDVRGVQAAPLPYDEDSAVPSFLKPERKDSVADFEDDDELIVKGTSMFSRSTTCTTTGSSEQTGTPGCAGKSVKWADMSDQDWDAGVYNPFLQAKDFIHVDQRA